MIWQGLAFAIALGQEIKISPAGAELRCNLFWPAIECNWLAD